MSIMIDALKITESGALERATLGRVPGTALYADHIGRVLHDSGLTEHVQGWGAMDGTVRVLVDEYGDPAYYIA